MHGLDWAPTVAWHCCQHATFFFVYVWYSDERPYNPPGAGSFSGGSQLRLFAEVAAGAQVKRAA